MAVWWLPHVDVALLLVVADVRLAAEPLPALTWADLLTADPVEATAVGFPDSDVEGGVRESRQIRGVVAPLSGVKAGHWVIQVEGGASAPSGSASAWAGMSGAALFAADRLIGIVTIDANPRRDGRVELRALPARAFAEDPLPAAWVRWSAGAGAWTRATAEPLGSQRLLRQLTDTGAPVGGPTRRARSRYGRAAAPAPASTRTSACPRARRSPTMRAWGSTPTDVL